MRVEPTEITAGALHLRAPRPRDVPELTVACQDPETIRWTRVPSPYRESDAQAFVARSAEQWAHGERASFVLLDATTASLLGAFGLAFGRDNDAEVGYWVSPGSRGQGVGSRALAAVCRWGFGALDLQRITWRAAVGNTASRRLAEKVGFTVEGTLRHGLVRRGEQVDCWIGSLLPGDPIRSSWNSVSGP